VIFSYPPCIRRARLGSTRRNIAVAFGSGKLEWWGYPTVKNFEDTFNRLDTIPACDRQTDRWTDRQTSCDGIVCAMHTRRAVKIKGAVFLPHSVVCICCYYGKWRFIKMQKVELEINMKFVYFWASTASAVWANRIELSYRMQVGQSRGGIDAQGWSALLLI